MRILNKGEKRSSSSIILTEAVEKTTENPKSPK